MRYFPYQVYKLDNRNTTIGYSVIYIHNTNSVFGDLDKYD